MQWPSLLAIDEQMVEARIRLILPMHQAFSSIQEFQNYPEICHTNFRSWWIFGRSIWRGICSNVSNFTNNSHELEGNENFLWMEFQVSNELAVLPTLLIWILREIDFGINEAAKTAILYDHFSSSEFLIFDIIMWEIPKKSQSVQNG